MEETKKVSIRRLVYLLTKKLIWNKYFFVILMFVVWMIFFDTHSLLNHHDLSNQIDKLKSERAALKLKLDESNSKYLKLKDDKSEREKYARENYFMKKDNEDIIIVTYKEDTITTNLK